MEILHFIGIGGIGVSALAQVALARGARVSGSDLHVDPHANPALARLLEGGATVHSGHRRENLAPEVSLVISSAAIPEDNPEIVEARRRGVRIVSRAEYLGELMAAHPGTKIAVAGTHGKTTTTGMIGVMLQEAGRDPTVFVGGEVPQLGGNVRIGSPEGPFVAEACEAYDSFLYLKPDIAVITNIETDHLDHYGTEDAVYNAFLTFANNIRPDGIVIFHPANDKTIQIMAEVREDILKQEYEITDCIAYRCFSGRRPAYATNVRLGGTTDFDWSPRMGLSDRGPLYHVSLKVPGRHNVLNALAACEVGCALGIPEQEVAAGVSEFRGAGRRQDTLGDVKLQGGSVLVMDDYAHHPTEIRVTLEAMRSTYPERRLVAIFQPHLYSRTRDFLPQFGEELAKADALFVTDVYAARETPLPGVRAADIATLASQQNGKMPCVYLPEKTDIPSMLEAFVQPNDLVVFMGAGDIREQGETFVDRLRTKETDQ